MTVPTLDQIQGALLYPDRFWSGGTVTYSIPTTGSLWPGYDPGDEPENADFGVLTSDQADRVRIAMALWDRVVNIHLLETNDVSNPGQIRVAFTDVNDYTNNPDTGAYAYSPPLNGGTGGAWNGDVWLDADMKSLNFVDRTYEYMTLLHEIGHALGLKHPFEGDVTLPADYDTTRYTVMSYTDYKDGVWVDIEKVNGVDTLVQRYVAPYTPMVFDIAALQARYGADTTTNADDTTYTIITDPVMRTFYDAGGIDTFDLTAHTRGSMIDLTPGSYSSTAYWSAADQAKYWTDLHPDMAASIAQVFADPKVYTWSYNLGLAYGTVIENVKAGSGNDTVMGNDVDNVIEGNGGQDYLRGGAGNDTLMGGDDFDDLNGNVGNDTEYGGNGADWVVGGKDNDQLYGESGNDIVYGNLGNDTISGGDGADWVRGGQGDDSVSGGAGDDLIYGDRGNDTISGGAGADAFHSFGDAGIDRVIDFNRAEGDRVILDPGTAYTVAQSGADVVISMTGGAQMILTGVSLSSLSDGWITVG
ncbi:matrixin family metalloprotease [Phenylobacterium aquaticum]|uniref:matrixin family metalloprotease n=1 Tax=Phenylobacterium aquaticum TaxID=1763816 RepID=UPI001F5D908D|nr:matrixin family metalloprotease [Phenylobacterium aquaticum]